MRNGYFQLHINNQGTKLRVFKAKDGGEEVTIQEVIAYLDAKTITYDLHTVNVGLTAALESDNPQSVIVISGLHSVAVDESYSLTVTPDQMQATMRLFPPSSGDTPADSGKRIMAKEVMSDLHFKGIINGVNPTAIADAFDNPRYMTDIVIAEGKPARHGASAGIEYFFNTNPSMKPTLNEDGTVDFFRLNNIVNCAAGELLARLTPEDRGESGQNIMGETVRPYEVKTAAFKPTMNVTLSADKLELFAKVDGHVTYVDGKVFVTNVHTVENVNSATGNIDFEGSVVVLGNVYTNFSVIAKGNIEVRGVVEGATLESGGDIIIDRGMKGMGRGTIKAANNVIAKFLENVKVEAGGYVMTDAILHSTVIAADEINVTGNKGFITGGRVCAGSLIQVKNLGSEMGADTVVEVGIDPLVKSRAQELQKRITELSKDVKTAQPILNAAAQKIAQGVKLTSDQIKYIQKMTLDSKAWSEELEASMDEYDKLQERLKRSGNAQVVVTGNVYSGTYIAIGDLSMTVWSTVAYCRFVSLGGEVKMTAI
ncbi:MAG: FapA family protein [Lachnospiraceae bacterium]|nr:FapA family protein [Lachnospiraceae bacterium]